MNASWTLWAWGAAVAIAIVAGVWAASNRREVRAALPLEHVAGATLIAMFGWEQLIHFPGAVLGFWTLTAGLGDVDGVEAQQLFLFAQAAFAVAAAFAVVGILRRRTWGAVLGIGLALAMVVSGVVNLAGTFQQLGESAQAGFYQEITTSVIGLTVVPGLAAAALLARPLRRPATPPTESTDRSWSGEPAPVDR